jgi:hypothetical protein
VAVFLGTVFIVWPGAILKLSFVKAYLFMAYLAVFRKAPWGQESLFDTWWQRFLNSPVEWLIILASIGLFMTDRELRNKGSLRPFLIFAGLMILATLRVTTGAPRYALPFMPALQVFAGLVIGHFLASRPARVAFAAATALSLGLLLSAWLTVNRHPAGADPALSVVLDVIRSDHLEAAHLLVPQDFIPSIHYYFPSTHLRGYAGADPTAAELEGGGLTGVLYRANPVRYQPLQLREPNLIK